MKKLLFLALLSMSASAFADKDPIMTTFKANNCFACHSFETKLVGPAFKDVAAKYKSDAVAEDSLVAKISKGTKGVWGSTAMPASDPNGIKQTEIRRMVKYILAQ